MIEATQEQKETGKFNFKTWGEFVTLAEQGMSELAMGSRSSRNNGRHWTGNTFAEAVKEAREGWPEGSNRINRSLEILQSHIPSTAKVQEVAYSQVGPGTLDMGRYIMGHPAPYVTWVESEANSQASGGIIRISMNVSSSGGVDKESLFNQGATVCMLIDLLERGNKRVELEVVMGSGPRNDRHSINITRVMVKNANDPLDMDRIAFATANAGMYRRLGFSLMEQMSPHMRRMLNVPRGGYGRVLDNVNVDFDGTDILIDSSSLRRMDYIESQKTWIRTQLAEQGLELIID